MILILGKGVTGQSFQRYCDKYLTHEKYIYYTEGDNRYKKYIDQIDQIFVSPGFHKNHKIFNEFRNIKIESDFSLIEQYIKNKYIIGITGTKGKSTLSSMIYHLLIKSGYDVALGGNIGNPVLDLLFNHEIYIFEISSYQLSYLNSFPWNISIITNLGIDHLDYHKDIFEYQQTKLKILNSTKENCIKFIRGLNYNIDLSNEEFLSEIIKSIPYNINYNDIKCFIPLKHRLEIIRYQDINIINDSCATNELAVQYALKKYHDHDTIWLVGGKPKSSITWINKMNRKNKITFGQIGNFTLEQAIDRAVSIVKTNPNIQNILFSPGCASFDEFKNAYERGMIFKSIILDRLRRG